MKTFRIVAITAIITASVCVAGSVLGAMVFSSGASAGQLNGYPTVSQPTPVVPTPSPTPTVQDTVQVAPQARQALVAPASSATLTDDQRIANLEARVSALESRVK